MKYINLKIIVIFVALLIVYESFISLDPRGANDFPYAYKEAVIAGFDLPRVWSDRFNPFGQYSVSTLWAWPLDFMYGLGGYFGIPFSVLERLIGVLLGMVISYFGIRRLFSYLDIGGWGKELGTLLFLVNTYVLLLIDGGQLSLVLAYGFLPVCFSQFRVTVERTTIKNLLGFILVVSLLSFADIRFLYLLFLLIFLDSIFTFYLSAKKLLSIATLVKIGIITLSSLLLIHAYWILPSLMYRLPALPDIYTSVEQINFLSFAGIGHALLFISPHWYQNVFGRISQPNPFFIIIPLAVFLIVLTKKNHWTVFWMVVALIGLLLIPGSNGPLPFLYPFFFKNLPGFILFRDPTKFFFLESIAYSILFALSMNLVIIKIGKNRKLFFITIFFALFYLLAIVSPAFTGKMTGLFSKPTFLAEYGSLSEVLKSDPNFSRVFWVPEKAPLGYSSPNHPSVNGIDQITKRPFGIGVLGTYETLNFLREASFMGEIFDVAGVGYIAYPYLDKSRRNFSSDDSRYYYTFLHQLVSLPWVAGLDKNSRIPLLRTKNHQDLFFISPNLWWVVGSDDIYNQATTSSQLRLAKNAMVFSESTTNLSTQLSNLPDFKIVLNKKGIIDLAASFIPQESLKFPAKQLDFQPDKTGWWKRESSDLISWRDFLQNKYGIDNQDFDLGGGWAVGEGNLSLIVKNTSPTDSVLLARVLESTKSGELKFYQDNNLIGLVNTNKSGNNISWHNIGRLKNSSDIRIDASGGINVISALAVVESDRWQTYLRKAANLHPHVTNFDVNSKLNSSGATLIFDKINPTKYQISISNVQEPVTLVFAQSFDPLWKLNGQTPLPVYSMLNAFVVTKDGEYNLEYDPQKYVYIGLTISITAAILGIVYLAFKYKKKV